MIDKKYHYYLLSLVKAHSPAQRKKLILAADNKIIQIISEIAYNILKGNVKLSDAQLNKLRGKYRPILRRLSDKNISFKKKQIYLANRQKGEFIPFIVPLISTLAGGLLSSILNK